jgi:hypothetical protein
MEQGFSKQLLFERETLPESSGYSKYSRLLLNWLSPSPEASAHRKVKVIATLITHPHHSTELENLITCSDPERK